MRLLMELATEHELTVVVNIHDVALAQLFVPRIVGLRAGAIVFDGGPADLTDDRLTEIYGEEDWTQVPAAGVEASSLDLSDVDPSDVVSASLVETGPA
jgi:phosphonate transport system ATP-binding protein